MAAGRDAGVGLAFGQPGRVLFREYAQAWIDERPVAPGPVIIHLDLMREG